MKNYIYISLLVTIGFSCTMPAYRSTNYFVSANAHSLIDSYRNLVDKAPNTGLSHYINEPFIATRRFVASAMPYNGYRTNTKKGYITYSSYNYFEAVDRNNPTVSVKSSTAAFHTAWHSDADIAFIIGNQPGDFVPNPIFLPDNNRFNTYHILFVPITTYQTSGLAITESTNEPVNTDYVTGSLLDIAINSIDIKAINDIYIEKENGFMSNKYPSKFTDLTSSIGLICEVVLLNGNKIKCYIFNNSDHDTLAWKIKK